MTLYAASCHDLGYLCEWQAREETRPATVAALAAHINELHDTGTTSPALDRLLDEWVHEVNADTSTSGGARRERTFAQRHLDRLVDAITGGRRATNTTPDKDQERA